MKAVLLWLTSPEWGQIVKALLHSLWQGGVLAVLLSVALRRISAPSLRYRLALGSLGGLLLATLFTWALLDQTANHPSKPPGNFRQGSASILQTDHQLNDSNETLVVTVAGTPQINLAAPSIQWTGWLALVWMFGALLMLTRAGIQVAGAERLRRSGKPLEDARIAQLLAEAQRAVRLARRIRITVTDMLTSPAVVGVLIPTLILPLSLVTTLTHEQLRFVLLHELAHIRRGDYFTNLFQLFMEALLFFNPAVWWISQQVRREREACCDALAIELSGAPVDYARTLVHVAESTFNPSPAAAAFGDKQREPSSLSDRVQRLLVPGYRPTLCLTWRAMLISLVAGGTLLVLSALGTRNTVGAILADKNAPHSPADASNQAAISTGQTKRLAFSDGREAINNRLDQIHLDRVHFKSTPLSDVIRILTQEAQNCDPERKGINFVLNSRPLDTVDQDRTIGTVMIVIDPPLTNLSLAELTEVIILVASQPISYSIEDFGVLFSLGKTPESLVSRRIKVNPATFSQRWLDRPNYVDAPLGTNRGSGIPRITVGQQPDSSLDRTKHHLHKLFTEAGVDMQPPKTFFYKERAGELFVRATPEEIERLTRVLAESGEEPLVEPARTNAAALVQSARLLLEAGQPDEAETKLKAALDVEPENQAAFYYLSYIKESRNRRTSGGQVVKANRDDRDGEDTTAGKLYSRRFKVDPHAFEQSLGIQWMNGEWWFPSKTNAHEGFIESVQASFTKVGVDLKPPKWIYYKNRTGELLIRATEADLDRLTPVLAEFVNRTPPNSNGLRETNSLLARPSHDARVKAAEGKSLFEVEAKEMNFDAGTRILTASNGVVIKHGETVITADSAHISHETGETVAEGNVKLQSAHGVVSGDRVTFDSKSGRMRAENASTTAPSSRGWSGSRIVLAEVTNSVTRRFVESSNKFPVLPSSSWNRHFALEKSLVPQINIKALFVEIKQPDSDALGFDWYLGSLLLTNSTATNWSAPYAILSDAQYAVVLRALEQRSGVDILTQPQVITASGRQARIQIEEMRTIVTGIDPQALTLPGITATNRNGEPAFYTTETRPFGQSLDVLATLQADGKTISLTATPKFTEFLGYDAPPTNANVYVNGRKWGKATAPLPRVRVEQATSTASILDGQTLMLMGTTATDSVRMKDKVPVLGDLPLLGRLFRSETKFTDKKTVIVFITPTLVDAAGNRIRQESGGANPASDAK